MSLVNLLSVTLLGCLGELEGTSYIIWLKEVSDLSVCTILYVYVYICICLITVTAFYT